MKITITISTLTLLLLPFTSALVGKCDKGGNTCFIVSGQGKYQQKYKPPCDKVSLDPVASPMRFL